MTRKTLFLFVLLIAPCRTLEKVPREVRSDSLRHIGVGRLPKHAYTVDMPLHTGLSVAARIGYVQYHTGEDTGADAAKRHRTDAG